MSSPTKTPCPKGPDCAQCRFREATDRLLSEGGNPTPMAASVVAASQQRERQDGAAR